MARLGASGAFPWARKGSQVCRGRKNSKVSGKAAARIEAVCGRTQRRTAHKGPAARGRGRVAQGVRLQGSLTGQFQALWVDILTGAPLKPGEFSRSGVSVTQTGEATGEYLLIPLHKTDESEDKVFTAVEVRSQVDLTVEEIIARFSRTGNRFGNRDRPFLSRRHQWRSARAYTTHHVRRHQFDAQNPTLTVR